VVGHLADVIMYEKFQVEIFRGYDFRGGRISHFPIDFCMGLTTVQRDCAACDGSLFSSSLNTYVNWALNSQSYIVLCANSVTKFSILNCDVNFPIIYTQYPSGLFYNQELSTSGSSYSNNLDQSIFIQRCPRWDKADRGA